MTLRGPVHLIGIGGAGMSAIARFLLERGVAVSGSDRQRSSLATSLEAAGAQLFIGHQGENVRNARVVVRSSAVRDDNPEVQSARQQGIQVLKRSDFLTDLIGEQTCIAVAGSHGKTTTTAMIAWMLTVLGQDPSYIIGGVSANLGTNAHAGKGAHFVIEADEYDGMFLGLRPAIAVVTNIEYDHPDLYPTPEDFYQAFVGFANGINPGGKLIACTDDPGATRLLAECRVKGVLVYAYGLGEEAHIRRYQATRVTVNAIGGYEFLAAYHPSLVSCSLQIPGQHNVANALAALAVADQLGLQLDKAARALNQFTGTGRRFDVRGAAGGVTVIDDYAHHPTHIRATLAAAHSRYPGQRLWAVWQPHTYSRTRVLLTDYARSFKGADRVLVTEVYAAREPVPGDGFSANEVVQAMKHTAVEFIPTLPQVTTRLLASLRPGDVVLVLSAGDADQISTQLLTALETGHPSIGD